MNESYHNTDLHEKIMGAVSAIETVIVGKHNEIVLLMTALLAGAHVLIEDVPGTGKTSLAAALSRVTGLDFNRAQFTPDVMASDITGFNIYNRQKESFEFREGLVMCNLLLADEINRASPKTQSALLEAMEENRVTVDGVTYDVPDPFMVIATQNPTGYVGTYPLPEAQLDRFAFKLSMGYPSQNEEVGILRARRGENPMDKLTSVVTAEELRAARAAVTQVRVDESLYTYIVSLVAATRQHKALSLGASPRASVALMHLAQAYAYLRGRDYVIPDDIAALYIPAVAHRVQLTQESKLSLLSLRDVLTEIMRSTDVPYLGTH
jgi:MoxR-like ATPase